MYEIALSVAACLRANTRVSVAWVVESDGLGAQPAGEALALTPGGGKVGTLLGGALDDQLAELHTSLGEGRLVDLAVNELEASLAGLSSAGKTRCLLVPAESLPAQLWDRLVDREPVCLVTRLDADQVGATTLFTADSIGDAPTEVQQVFGREASETSRLEEAVVTSLWPVPKLVIVGRGPVAAALTASAALLGWHTQTVTEPRAATAMIRLLTALDKVVVMGHDLDLVGPALTAALASQVGYVGALGGRQLQETRARWLADRGVSDPERIHGPAGLDIGAATPAEIAVSILAEAIAAGRASASSS